MAGFQQLSNNELLQSWCAEVSRREPIALDTEFERQKTYFAELCLLQLNAGDNVVLIDPFEVSLAPIVDRFQDEQHQWLVHAGRQDVEILCQIGDDIGGPVYDTQLAAALCGFPGQIGYAELVQRVLGVELEKSQTRTDWRRRPLTSAQLSYAADDVRYLPSLQNELLERLSRLGRDSWYYEDCRRTYRNVVATLEPASAWERVKGLGKLSDDAFARAFGLAAWRECEAQRRNRPRGWILSDQALVTCAENNPADRRELAALLRDAPGLVRKNGDALIDAISNPDAAGTVPKRPPRPDAEVRAIVKDLAARIRQTADALQLEASVLMKRRDIELAAQGKLSPEFVDGWRYQQLEDLLKPFV